MAKIGLSETTELKEKIVKIDETKAIRYKVVEEVIDLTKLRSDLAYAQSKLAAIPPSVPDSELLSWAKANHPNNMNYENERVALEKMVADANVVLEGIK